MKINSIIVAGLALMSMPCFALEVVMTPGSSSHDKLVLANTADDMVTLKGTTTSSELGVLKFMSRNVKSLDMAQLKISDGIIPEGMLIGSGITSVALPSDIIAVEESAFAGSNLVSVTVPASVTAIGDYAFAECGNLRNVEILGETSLGKGVFKADKSLQSVKFTYSPVVIPESVFDGCGAYAETLSASVKEVGAYAYRGTALSVLDITHLTKIGDFAFADMPNLSEITFDVGNDIQTGKGVFFADTKITELPGFKDVLSPLLLAHTGGRATVYVNAGTIGEGAYANNQSIDTLTFGPQVQTIKANAFRNISKLSMVDARELGKNVPEVDQTSFSGLEDENGRYPVELNVAKETGETWKSHPVWGLFNIQEGGSNVVNVIDTEFTVSATRNGDTVNVVSARPVEYLGIYNLAGLTLHESRPYIDSITVSDLGDEVLVVKVVSDGHVKIFKLK